MKIWPASFLVTGVSAHASTGYGGRGCSRSACVGLEAGQEGVDAELELVVGGDPGQLRGQLDGVGELAGWQGGEKGPHAADELVAGLRGGAGPGNLQGDEAQDVG